MALTASHQKTNNIADWTQAELDAQIALGNYPPGTLLADIVLPTDWNAAHTVSGTLDASSVTLGGFLTGFTQQVYDESIYNTLIGAVTINMGNADYTMTTAEAVAPKKVIVNSGDGTKTLTWPTTSDGLCSTVSAIVTAFSTNGFYAKSQTVGGAGSYISAPSGDIIAYYPSAHPSGMLSEGVSDAAFSAAWNGSLYIPTKNAVYDAIQNFSFGGLVTKTTTSEQTETTDRNKRVYCSNGSNVTFTIRPSSSADLGENATFRLQAGAGGITIAAGAGVTLIGSTTVAAYDTIICDRDGTTETWYL